MVKKNKVSLEELVSKKDVGNPMSRHAGLLSINGEGVLITGESGIGKSEAAWELLEKGYHFIADDVVELRRIGNSIYGNACKESKGFMEARDLGVINVKGTFGASAVKEVERLDLIVNLVKYKEHSNTNYDLVGEEISYAEVMGVLVPHVTITVRSEKSVANVIKIAAMNNRRRFLGFVASEELYESLGMENSKSESIPKIIPEKEIFRY
jgi:HPr kinase/phosphorylase